ncbi:MAG: CBS domain-containing protein [Rhodocyclaceae bacterium]|nr:CBS domain-containing protein [Rhodocyclaceae bacterium]MBX3667574.1 CBS domain-containing protein [Rhodocyclaceae bacterium]
MKSVAQLLAGKPTRDVLTISPRDTVLDASRIMTQHNVGALLVKDGDTIVGVVSERDFARKLVAQEKSIRTTLVGEIMSAPVMFVKSSQTTEDCMAIMTGNRFRHLPVMDAGKLVGLISIGDLVKDVIAEQQFVIEQLEHYITGTHG